MFPFKPEVVAARGVRRLTFCAMSPARDCLLRLVLGMQELTKYTHSNTTRENDQR